MTRHARPFEAGATFLHLIHVETDKCVEWPFSTVGGYGQVRIDSGRPRRAHRLALQLRVGPPPSEGLDAAHNCGNRLCINYRHLRWATRAENNWDRWIHGTHNMGEQNPCARLTEGEVRLIRSDARSAVTVAADYGVSPTTVHCIRNRKRWGSVA